MKTHTGSTSQVFVKGFCCRIDSIGLESNDSSKLKSTRHTRSLFARQFESIPQVATKWGNK